MNTIYLFLITILSLFIWAYFISETSNNFDDKLQPTSIPEQETTLTPQQKITQNKTDSVDYILPQELPIASANSVRKTNQNNDSLHDMLHQKFSFHDWQNHPENIVNQYDVPDELFLSYQYSHFVSTKYFRFEQDSLLCVSVREQTKDDLNVKIFILKYTNKWDIITQTANFNSPFLVHFAPKIQKMDINFDNELDLILVFMPQSVSRDIQVYWVFLSHNNSLKY